jgi:quercetin dioxygenase-like cupin family protein
VGVVTEGSFNFQVEGRNSKIVSKGDGFFEPAGQTILRFDNASASEPSEIVCFYLTDSDGRPAIEMLDGDMAAQLGSDEAL